MKKLSISKKIYIDKSKIEGAGRGVFAKKNIKKGETIETCPFIEIPYGDPANLFGSKLVTYFFYFGKDKDKIALVLGCGCLYNHSNNPNTTFKVNRKQNTITFTALRHIKKDKEITFNYRGSGGDSTKTPLWFELL